MKRILIANIFGIGDVLFTTPLIANLKRADEGAEVGFLCNARAKAVLENNPDIDEIFVYEKDEFVKLWKESKIKCLKALNNLFSAIRKMKYDTVFDFTLSREFGLAFLLAGIPKRIGLNYKNRGFFLTRKLPLTGFANRHVIEHYLDLLKFAGVNSLVREMRLDPSGDALLWAADYLRDKGMNERPRIAVIPGGGASWGEQAARKRWDASGFAGCADLLAIEGFDVLILGDSSEKELCAEVAGKMNEGSKVVENGLELDKYIALLARCDLVLCNDGGPLHIAVALGRKTVSIFGPVDDRVYGPYPLSWKHKVITAEETPCRPCYDRFKLPERENENRCLTDIDPGRVADACLGLLNKKEK